MIKFLRELRHRSALLKAVHLQDLDKVEALVAAGLDVNFATQGHSPLALAALKGRKEILRVLLAPGALLNSPGNEWILIGAAKNGDHELIDRALAAGHDIHFAPPNAPSPLQAAAFSNRPNTIRHLIERGATKEDFDVDYCSWARLNSTTIELLMELGVKVPSDVADGVKKRLWD